MTQTDLNLNPNLDPSLGNPALIQKIAQRINTSPDRRISFAEFMEMALYDPEYGYYATNQVKIGAEGDFVTSPHFAADFGELLAEQFVDMWQLLGCPRPFTLLEMGAGQGLLVQDIVRYLHKQHFECFEALEYIIVEASTGLIAEQRQRLQKLADSWGHLHWRTWDEIPPHSIVGCCFSNELVDAFPVHRVAIAQGTLQEIYITLAPDGCFTEVLADPSTAAFQDYFQLSQISLTPPQYPEGYRTEVNLAAQDWLRTVSDRLRQGYLLTIDYGYPAHRYYAPTRRDGTLLCYYQHRHHNDPYHYIGQQDLTAHVNFTALEQQGSQYNLENIGFIEQGLFLMALGLGDRIAALSFADLDANTTLSSILQRREALHSLINPTSLGGFGVLVQGKALNADQKKLRGLQVPL